MLPTPNKTLFETRTSFLTTKCHSSVRCAPKSAGVLLRLFLSALIGLTSSVGELSVFAESVKKEVVNQTNDSTGSGIPADAVLVPELSRPDMDVRSSGNRLFIHLRTLPEKNELQLPRLGNSVRAIRWLSVPSKDVVLKPEIETWVITLPQRTGDSGNVLVVELDAPVTLMTTAPIEKPDAGGVIFLPASHGVTKGKNLRYEPQPHKNTVGYWSVESDTVEWRFSAAAAAEYEVDILQGCGKGHGGSRVSILLNEQEAAEFDVRETGHFQNFIWRTVGSVNLRSGNEQTLRIVPRKKVAGAVMDVRAVRLVPKNSKAERSMAPQLADPGALPDGL